MRHQDLVLSVAVTLAYHSSVADGTQPPDCTKSITLLLGMSVSPRQPGSDRLRQSLRSRARAVERQDQRRVVLVVRSDAVRVPR